LSNERINFRGKMFGRLKALVPIGGSPYYKWKCKCLCGKIVQVAAGHLRKGDTKSCGCYRRDCNTKHGQGQRGKATGFWISWKSLKARLRDLSYHGKQYYKDKGITHDPRWSFFEVFREDMERGWFSGAVLHRKNGWEGYWKKNCVWMSKSDHTALHNKQRGRKQYEQ